MASARLFEHNNFSGRNLLLDNPGHQRYLLATFDFLNGLSFNDIVSSLWLRSSTPSIQSACILLQRSQFSGALKSFAPIQATVTSGGLPDFNDLTSSVLLMDHDPSANKTVLAIRSLAGSRLNDALDNELKNNSDASRSGDVLVKFTIDLFEVSLFGVDLMLIEVPVRIHTPWPFSDYSAKIRYWINLFINGSHQVRAFVAAWGYWIEGGVLTSSIERRLRPKGEAKIGSVDTQVNNMLTDLNFHQWTDVYLMPGQASVTADYSDNLDDDCTIVLPY